MSRERLASLALAAAFVLVVGLAAADAVRKRGHEAPAATTAGELPDRQRIAERLRLAGVRGELLVTPAGDCRPVPWSLPELAPGRVEACRPPPDPAVAERPDGLRSLAGAEGIVLLPDGCEGSAACRRLLVPQAALDGAARRHPSAPTAGSRLRVPITGHTWLGDRDVAVLLGLRRAGRPDLRAYQVLAFFRDSRFRGLQPARGDLRQPTASPDGSSVALLPGVVVRVSPVSEITLPPFLRRSIALAWSPDGRWLALAQRASVVLVSAASLDRYDTTGSGLRTIDLPLEAAALEWR